MTSSVTRQAPLPDGYDRFDPLEIEASIAERFEKMAARYPDHLAYDDDLSRSMTYAELNDSANRIAAHLLDQSGERAGKTVALLIGQSAEAVIAAMGLLKAGRMIVALDPTFPADRNHYMLQDSGAKELLTDRQHRAAGDEYASDRVRVQVIEEIVEQTGHVENPAVRVSPDTYSHLIYTSGSTGRPKGVLHTQRTLLHLQCYANQAYGFCSQDRNALLASMGYGNIMMQLYNSLLNGGTVIPFNLRTRPMGDMPEWLRTQKISYISYTPSTFRHFSRYLTQDGQFPDLRILAIGGESYRPDDIRAYRRWFSQSTLSISYGTSEALWITQGFIQADSDIDPQAIPSGYEFGEHQIKIVDDDGQPVRAGEIGSAVVRSAYLTPGYLQRPDLNESTFHADPEHGGWQMYNTGDLVERHPDGLIIHRGRKDHQIKIRGFRVEAGEVETALTELDDIAAAAVTVITNTQGTAQLAAYVVAQDYAAPSPASLRTRLADRLPSYMVPTHFVMMDSLPRTVSGKIDRKALPPPTLARPALATAYRAPETALEATITAIWEELFGIDHIGVDDNFLGLGGHSMLATQIVSEVRRRLASQISLARMFETETIAELAALITAEGRIEGDSDAVGDIEKVDRGGYKKKLHESGTILGDEFE